MPKRSIEDKLNKYKAKIRKIEKKKHEKGRKSAVNCHATDTGVEDIMAENSIEECITPLTPPPTPSLEPQVEVEVPQIDPQLLSALGDDTNEGSKFGPNIHPTLAERWDPILKKGLPKEIKEKLMKEYLVPENLIDSSTWDPQLVLDYVSNWYPNVDLSLEKLTKKLVLLLALCTGHRVQTLSFIKIKNISIQPEGIKIVINDIIKTSMVGKEQPLLFLPYFRDNPKICPASVIQDYIEITSRIRPGNMDHLLITVKRPHRNATAQSISRWIKQGLAESGVDVTTFGAHSTRHAATSAAASAGVSLDVIRKAAGWTARSETFARFYHRQIIDESYFARAICNVPHSNATD